MRVIKGYFPQCDACIHCASQYLKDKEWRTVCDLPRCIYEKREKVKK